MYMTSKVARFLAPTPLGDGAWLALSEPRRNGRGVGLAFVQDGTDVALMGVPVAAPDVVLAAIAAAIPDAVLKRIFILEWDDRLIDVLNGYAALAPEAVVVADRRVAAAIGPDIPLRTIAVVDAGDTVVTPSGRMFCFVPSPFVFTPSALMVHDPGSRTLFTNRLFEITWDRPAPATLAETSAAMRDYARMYAPSSDYLRPVLAAIAKIAVDRVVTRSGATYAADVVGRLIADLSATEFFNSPRTVGKPSDVREFSHAALATQVLFKLAAAFGEEAVLASFAGTEFTIRPKTYEITTDGPDDYRVWHRLFDIVYLKQGSPWLAVAEPLVDKLVALYGVTKPAVYQSVVAAALSQATRVESEKRDLETRVRSLEDRLAGTLDKITRDPMTGVYNELFLREFLAGAIASDLPGKEPPDLGLLYVAVDDIARINARYSKATGDETIKHLGYVLDNTRRPQDVVFKRVGPGFIVLLADGGNTAAQETLRTIRDAVRGAEAFIEPITVSAAFVRLAEFPRQTEASELVERLLGVGEIRIRSAVDRGSSAYVDEKMKIESVRVGRVLLVDDDPAALALLGALLRSENYDVATAADGLEALATARAKRFDYVLCERNVPKLDGFALRQELYAEPATAPRLFLLTTYHKTRETVIRANRAEIDVVLEKPLIFEEVTGYLRRSLKREGTVK